MQDPVRATSGFVQRFGRCLEAPAVLPGLEGRDETFGEQPAAQVALRRDVDYELSGSFAVDIHFAKPLGFKSGGNIELQAAVF